MEIFSEELFKELKKNLSEFSDLLKKMFALTDEFPGRVGLGVSKKTL